MVSAFTYTATFTETQARYLASKVAADLRQLSFFYGRPREHEIDAYVQELAILLPGGYLDSIDYGFIINGGWVTALRYEVNSDGTLTTDDRAGRVPPNAALQNASW